MRICSYVLANGTRSYGIVDGDLVRDVGETIRGQYPDLRAALASGVLSDVAEGASGSAAVPLDSLTLLPPITNPDKIICIGLNYMGHIKETGRDAPSHPSIFTRYPSSLVGHDQPMVRASVSTWFDFEGELAVIIGKAGRAIPAERAMSHVAGYTCFNDGTIRDFQRHTTQFWAGKNFDRSGSMGPWFVTADEFGNPADQSMVTRLNGEVMQSTSIADLAFDIPTLIAYLSTVCELLPGDIIATGTPSGVGMFREPKLFMKAGDRIEVEITGIGTLANAIVDES
ncbi:fumarylacetoacetate hydrolase family protein [Oryzicola mucosus]|uniref:Fumarylacetoacetate hydrolase family protein n=1 Tax=Oryzicola mucosus TaxID=2767425 RepID=A0A8J6U1Q3_9HYPH|nr:fumarylacetoacetate hydrolase family protein [Oryzicola mucosus]MBD0417206.1 fumarylacetoacetate hydrolase family protein [Oryzicola mucosus]